MQNLKFTWTYHITQLIGKVQQRQYFQRSLREFKLSSALLCNIYRSTIESVLTNSITVWYGNSTQADGERLQRVIKTAQHITVDALPSLQDIYQQGVLRRVHKHHQGAHPPLAPPRHTPAIKQTIQECEMQDLPAQRQLLQGRSTLQSHCSCPLPTPLKQRNCMYLLDNISCNTPTPCHVVHTPLPHIKFCIPHILLLFLLFYCYCFVILLCSLFQNTLFIFKLLQLGP